MDGDIALHQDGLRDDDDDDDDGDDEEEEEEEELISPDRLSYAGFYFYLLPTLPSKLSFR